MTKITSSPAVENRSDRSLAPLRTLLERLEAAQESTRDAHVDEIRRARSAFEQRLAQAVAYRLTQALDAIVGD
jgi:DNA-binding GntR family transcriptional regulator